MSRFNSILPNEGDGGNIADLWDSTEAAAENEPLPSGRYACRVLSGQRFTSRNQKPGFKLTFEVATGEHAGRRLWLDLWLTPKALPYTKRDLAKLGVTTREQLERPIPAGWLADVTASLRTADDGRQFSDVSRFEVTGREEVIAENFAPDAGDPSDDSDAPF